MEAFLDNPGGPAEGRKFKFFKRFSGFGVLWSSLEFHLVGSGFQKSVIQGIIKAPDRWNSADFSGAFAIASGRGLTAGDVTLVF